MDALPIYDPIHDPLRGSVLIHGAGEEGLFLSRHFECLEDIRLLGFLDCFKEGEARGLMIRHPQEQAYPTQDVTVVLATFAAAVVVPLLLAQGYTRILNGMPFHRETIKRRHDQLIAAQDLVDSQNYQGAIALLEGAIQIDPLCAEYYTLLCMAHRGMKSDEALTMVVTALSRAPNMPLYRSDDFRIQQKLAQTSALPSIFLNTQFKSGSVFLRDALCRGLQMPWMFLFPEGYHPDLVESWMWEFAAGGVVSQQHASSDSYVQRVYREVPHAKYVLHLRDPRQSAVSAVHHFERVLEKGPEYARLNLILENPKGYPNWSFEQKMDLYLGRSDQKSYTHLNLMSFPFEVHWVDGWLAALARGEFANIILTDYNDLQHGQALFVRNLLQRLGISEDQFDFSCVAHQPTPGQAHYRKGDPDEWKTAMTKAQIEAANAMMTPRLRDRYG